MNKTMIQRVLVPILFLLGGIVFLVMGCIRLHQKQRYVKTTGEITKIESYYTENAEPDGGQIQTYDVTVQFTVNGTTYTAQLDEYRASFEEGGTVDILYDPDAPEKIMYGSTMVTVLQFGLGAVFAISGAFGCIRNLFRRRVG